MHTTYHFILVWLFKSNQNNNEMLLTIFKALNLYYTYVNIRIGKFYPYNFIVCTYFW